MEPLTTDYDRCIHEPSSAEGAKKGTDGSGYGRAISSALNSNFGRYISELRRNGLDLVLVIDGTGSMKMPIDDIAVRVRQIIFAIHRLVPTARIGAVVYYDKGVKMKSLPLTMSSEKLDTFFRAKDLCGCASWQADMLGGIRTAIDEMDWKPYARRVIVLVGDSPPDKQDFASLLQPIRKFNAENGAFNIVDVAPQEHERFEKMYWTRVHHKAPPKESWFPEYDRETQKSFREMATAGGGTMKPLMPRDNIGQVLLVLAFGEKWEQDTAQFGKAIAAGGGK